MKKNLHLILVGAAVLLVLASQSLYIVQQPEQAIVLQFGNPVRLIQEPGLKIKMPFIQNVVFYDRRLLNLEPPAQEVVLKDKKRLDVDTFSRYRIVEPLTFYKTVRNEYQAQNRLQEIVNSSARNVLATFTLKELLSEKRTEIMKQISDAVKADAAQLGVEVAKKYKESETVIHAIHAHHGEVEAKNVIACIVQAADAISAARPGARRENIENNIKRLEKLEEIANSFSGVESSYAIQAGREVRIIVKPDAVTDDQMVLMAHDISARIENELEYPGQIKVNEIRESRAVDYAK